MVSQVRNPNISNLFCPLGIDESFPDGSTSNLASTRVVYKKQVNVIYNSHSPSADGTAKEDPD
jgi:hypothetical protein